MSFGSYSQFKQFFYKFFNATSFQTNNNNNNIDNINNNLINNINNENFDNNLNKINNNNNIIEIYKLNTHLAHISAGMFTGMMISLLSTPFEFVKVHMQLDNLTEKRFKNSFDCAKKTVGEKGLNVLYRGFIVNTIREMIFGLAYFGLYEYLKFAIQQKFISANYLFNTSINNNNNNNNNNNYNQNINNINNINNNLIKNNNIDNNNLINNKNNNNNNEVNKNISGEILEYNGKNYEKIENYTNNYLYHLDKNRYDEGSYLFSVVLAGGFSGMLAWFLSFPFDSIKNHIQSPNATKFKMTEVAREIWIKRGGLRGFYSGIVPSITRAFVVSATRFSVYEWTIQMIVQYNNNK